MPLFGSRLHILNKTYKKAKKKNENYPPNTDLPRYIVKDTQEICDTPEEIALKNAIYAEKFWTCRATGKAGLSYMEAVRSETLANRALRKNFPKCFEKPVLELVHSNTMSLDSLVHLVYLYLNQQFVIGEPVSLKVDLTPAHPVEGAVFRIDKSSDENVLPIVNGTTSPDSSDKENSSSKRPIINKKNYMYSVKLSSEDPLIVNDIPHSSLERIQKPPSKDCIKLFIRTHAMRLERNSSGPWIVDLEHLRRHKIPSKGPAFEIDKSKLSSISRLIEEECYGKIGESPTCKKKKMAVVEIDDDDNLPLTAIKMKQKQNGVLNKVKKKLKQSTLHFDKKNVESSVTPRKSAELPLPPLAQRLVKAVQEKKDATIISSLYTRCAQLLSKSQINRLPLDVRDKVKERSEKLEQRKRLMNMTPEERESYFREQKAKQRKERLEASRLFDDLDLLNSGHAPASTVSLPSPEYTTVTGILSQGHFGRLLGIAEFLRIFVGLLSNPQVLADQTAEDSGPTETAAQMDKLTEIEPDVEIFDHGLPISIPDDDPSLDTEGEEEESSLIAANAPLPFCTIRALHRLGLDRLSKAIISEQLTAGGFRSLTRPIAAILRLLLHEEELGNHREMGLRLADLPVTPYTAPELLRLTLQRGENFQQSTGRAESIHRAIRVKMDNTVVMTPESQTSRLIKQLSQVDIDMLSPESRLIALETIVEHLLDLDLIDAYVDAMHIRYRRAQSKRAQLLKDLDKRNKERGRNDKSAGDKSLAVETSEESSTNGKRLLEEDLSACDLASLVKRRRVLAAQAAAEREAREREERERRAMLAVVQVQQRHLAAAERSYELAKHDFASTQRVSPLGLDRNHRRIWHFRCAPDRIFLEDNWAPQAAADIKPALPCSLSSSSSTTIHNKSMDSASTFPHSIKSSVSHQDNSIASLIDCGQYSTWSLYRGPQCIEAFINCLLEKGERESKLKAKLVASDGPLNGIFSRYRKTDEEKRDKQVDSASNLKSNEDQNLKEGPHISIEDRSQLSAVTALAGALIKNLLDTEIRLRNGGLGGVVDFPKWQERLARVQADLGLSTNYSRPPLDRHRQNGIAPSPHSPTFESCSRDSQPTDRLPAAPLLHELSSLLLEVANQIHPRFLKVPKLREPRSVGANSEKSPGNEMVEVESTQEDIIQDKETDSECDSDTERGQVRGVEDPAVHEARVKSWMAEWRKEVKASKTLARLNFLHACLDVCIRWERSVEDARCRVCRRKTDDDNLLLCDTCNAAFHLYCLRPPLKRVPTGDWFCPGCRPQPPRNRASTRTGSANALTSRRVRSHSEASNTHSDSSSNISSASEKDSVDDAEALSSRGRGRLRIRGRLQVVHDHRSDAISGSDDEDEDDDSSDESDDSYHASCFPKRRSTKSSTGRFGKRSRPAGDRKASVQQLEAAIRAPRTLQHDSCCLVCDVPARPSLEAASLRSNGLNNEALADDSADSHLIACSACPSVFHAYCHQPPLRRPPRGDTWLCSDCRSSCTTRTRLGLYGAGELRRFATRPSRKNSYLQAVRAINGRHSLRKQTSALASNSRRRIHSDLPSVCSTSTAHARHPSIRNNNAVISADDEEGDEIMDEADKENATDECDEYIEDCEDCEVDRHLNSCSSPGFGVQRASMRLIGRRSAISPCACDSLSDVARKRGRPKGSSKRHNIFTSEESSLEEEDDAGEETDEEDEQHQEIIENTNIAEEGIENGIIYKYKEGTLEVGDESPRSLAASSTTSIVAGPSSANKLSGDVVLSNGESEQCLIGSPTEVGSVGRGRRGRPSRDSTGDSLSPRHAVLRFIDEIESSQNSWPFLEPVDPKEAPDYYEVIKNPVDLSMIRRWTIEGRYDNEGLAMLARDLGDMFYNAELYNSMDSEVWQAGSRFEQLIRNKFAKTRPTIKYSRALLDDIQQS